MKYSPSTEKELRSAMVMDPGIYSFEVISAKDATSKKGNDMIELTLRVFPNDPDSGPRIIKDWLVAGSPLGELKINNFCHCVGIQDAYFAGEFSAFQCEGQAGSLRLTIQASEQYGDQNSVKAYVVPKADQSEPVNGQAKAAADLTTKDLAEALASADKDIPF